MDLLQLTVMVNSSPTIYINTDEIAAIKEKSAGTAIFLKGGLEPVTVRESASDIIHLLKAKVVKPKDYNGPLPISGGA